MVRRLPVLQSADADPVRPRWHWTLIGAGLVVVLWAPLSMLALFVGLRWMVPLLVTNPADVRSSGLVQAGIALVAYVTACVATGAVIARFGAPAGPREALYA